MPCVLMEDEETLPGEEKDLARKLKRLLETGRFAAIVVVWPRGAKMAATHDELLLLVEFQRTMELPEIHLLHHPKVARMKNGELEVLERGGRSRYIESFQQLPLFLHPWRTQAQLTEALEAIRDELT